MPPLVSIVILNWNGRAYLEKCLSSVLRSEYPRFQVVVADNGSTDGSLDFVAARYPEVHRIALDSNYGFADGYNRALAQVNSDYFLLLNSDVEVEPGWLWPLVEQLEGDPAIGASQPKLLQYDDRGRFEYSGACGGWLDSLGYPFALGRIFDVCERDQGQYDQPAPIFWASGAALFVRAGLYRRLGGLDPLFFAHQEEIDFCWRLQRAGYRVYSCPASVVYHVGGGTLPKGNSRKVFLNFRNNLIMLAKNLSPGEALRKIPLRLILDLLSALKSLGEGEWGYFFSVLRAHLAFFRWLFGRRTPRKMTGPMAIPPGKGNLPEPSALLHPELPRPRLTSLQGVWRGCVVWAYFVRGRTRFQEIVGQGR